MQIEEGFSLQQPAIERKSLLARLTSKLHLGGIRGECILHVEKGQMCVRITYYPINLWRYCNRRIYSFINTIEHEYLHYLIQRDAGIFTEETDHFAIKRMWEGRDNQSRERIL